MHRDTRTRSCARTYTNLSVHVHVRTDTHVWRRHKSGGEWEEKEEGKGEGGEGGGGGDVCVIPERGLLVLARVSLRVRYTRVYVRVMRVAWEGGKGNGRKMWIGRGWQSQQWRPARAFIIMIILDIPCPKQDQPASQPAKLSLLSFPILILFLPGRSGRHISRSGHKIHSPFPQPPIHLDCLTPFYSWKEQNRGKEKEKEGIGNGDRGRENNPRFRLSFTLVPLFLSSFSLCQSADYARSVLLLINGRPAIFFPLRPSGPSVRFSSTFHENSSLAD